MTSIIGNITIQSDGNVTLYDYDWKSMDHWVQIYLEKIGWSYYPKEKTFTLDDNRIKITNHELTYQKYESNISGNIDRNFNYMIVIRKIIEMLEDRYVVADGRIVIDETDSDKVYIVLINNNRVSLKEGTF